MSDLIQLVASWPGAALLRRSSLAYLLVNASHILGIALLLGPILALDARLLGAFRTVPLTIIGPFLSGAAKLGVGLAIVTGLTLFSVGPQDYVNNPAFLAKLALLTLAIINAITLDRSRARCHCRKRDRRAPENTGGGVHDAVAGGSGRRPLDRLRLAYLPSMLGHVPCRSVLRPTISKPWAPKKSRWPWVRLAVPWAWR